MLDKLRRLWPWREANTSPGSEQSTEPRAPSSKELAHRGGMLEPEEQAPAHIAHWVRNWSEVAELAATVFPPPATADSASYDGEYYRALTAGRVFAADPEKLKEIADAFGFDYSYWHRPVWWWSRVATRLGSTTVQDAIDQQEEHYGKSTVSRRINRLFEDFPDWDTGEVCTDAQVAQASGNRLTEDDVRAIRMGEDPYPTRGALLAFCDFFGVDFAYFENEEEETLPAAGGFLLSSIIKNSIHTTSPGMVEVIATYYVGAERVLVSEDGLLS